VTVDQLERDRLALVAAARAWQPEVVRRLPDSLRLDVDVDVPALARELDGVSAAGWAAQRTASAGTVVEAGNDGWRVLALRSVGGDPARTDAGGAELGPTDWTPHAARFPAVRAFLASLPLELAAVRLMALEPGGRSPEHVDTCMGLPWGRLRLHLPLHTSPAAHVVFEGRRVHWDRHLWYGSFSLPHLIENLGGATRIHLVIDGEPRPGFLDLLPEAARRLIRPAEVLVPEPFVPAPPGTVPLAPTEVDLPAPFLNLAAPAGEFVGSGRWTRVRVEPINASAMALTDAARRRYVLLRTAEDTYRLLGWPHKTIAFRRSPFGVAARLGTRVGPVEYHRVVPAAT
jgi:aspartate beta-hydroxylase